MLKPAPSPCAIEQLAAKPRAEFLDIHGIGKAEHVMLDVVLEDRVPPARATLGDLRA
jgi:hypothetical protein